MRTFCELIDEQKKIEKISKYLKDFYNVNVNEVEIFKIAEKLQKEEYVLIFFLHTRKGWSFAHIGRLLGKKRCVIRKKYINCLKLLGGEGDNS